jgi:hypothetical protein
MYAKNTSGISPAAGACLVQIAREGDDGGQSGETSELKKSQK